MLSELEGCVVGHLWKYGPCTAYAVRKELLASPSSHWSGSAGAIYPLLERLEKRGLVASRKTARGDRQHWLYELTKTGREFLLGWLAPSLDPDLVSIAPDPLRTRIYFLGALPPRRRSAFLAQARAKLIRHMAALKDATETDEFDRLANRGAVRLARARVAWLEDVERALAATPSRKRTRVQPRTKR
jgi:DNA-binding PadR family transcriptional regulator